MSVSKRSPIATVSVVSVPNNAIACWYMIGSGLPMMVGVTPVATCKAARIAPLPWVMPYSVGRVVSALVPMNFAPARENLAIALLLEIIHR